MPGQNKSAWGVLADWFRSALQRGDGFPVFDGGPFSYDPEGNTAEENSESKNGEGPFRPLNALTKGERGQLEEYDAYNGKWPRGSRLDVAIYPVPDEGKDSAKFMDPTDTQVSGARHSQIMFWDRRACAFAENYADEWQKLRNSEYHIVHQDIPQQDGNDPPPVFSAKFARRRHIGTKTTPPVKVAWWRQWGANGSSPYTDNPEDATPFNPTVDAPKNKAPKANPKTSKQTPMWAQKEVPDNNNNYAPRWELCHLLFYQLNTSNANEPVGSTAALAKNVYECLCAADAMHAGVAINVYVPGLDARYTALAWP